MFELRSFVIGIILMLKKYTCFNITIYAETNEEDCINGIYALPIIGLAVGFIAFILSSLKIFYDDLFVSAIILSFYNIITKTVNMKETYRTLNYYIKPTNQTEQLAGIIGIVIINLMYFSLFRIVSPTALVVMAVVGFSSPIILSAVIKRNKENTFVLKYSNKYHIIAAFIISFLIASIFNYRMVISLSLTYMLSIVIVSFFDEKIQFLPSSVEGFFIEISQVLFLIITYLMKLWNQWLFKSLVCVIVWLISNFLTNKIDCSIIKKIRLLRTFSSHGLESSFYIWRLWWKIKR